MYFRDLISNAKQNQACLRAELGDKTISPVASFVLGIHFSQVSQVNTLPKAKSQTRSKQNKDMHKCSSVCSERGVPLPVLTSGGE